jgi:hypothetical protein
MNTSTNTGTSMTTSTSTNINMKRWPIPMNTNMSMLMSTFTSTATRTNMRGTRASIHMLTAENMDRTIMITGTITTKPMIMLTNGNRLSAKSLEATGRFFDRPGSIVNLPEEGEG